jgi:hypothetical protein
MRQETARGPQAHEFFQSEARIKDVAVAPILDPMKGQAYFSEERPVLHT